MAVSSGGGHWVELRRLRAAFAGLEVVYVSTDASAAAEVPAARHYAIRNVTRRDRLGFAVLAWQLARILLRERPDVVVTTGAAPGFVALLVAKGLLGSARSGSIRSPASRRCRCRRGWRGRSPTPGWCNGRISPGPRGRSTGAPCSDPAADVCRCTAVGQPAIVQRGLPTGCSRWPCRPQEARIGPVGPRAAGQGRRRFPTQDALRLRSCPPVAPSPDDCRIGSGAPSSWFLIVSWTR